MIHKAIGFVARAHRRQRRKGTDLPYVWHPLGVGWILQSWRCPEEVVAAGLLHDVIENTSITAEELRLEFGPRTTEIVLGCTEDKRLDWEKRKELKLASLSTSPFEVRLVTAADKIDNLRSIASAQAEVGESVWSRFLQGRERQEWYYRGVARGVKVDPGREHGLFAQLAQQVEAVFGAEP